MGPKTVQVNVNDLKDRGCEKCGSLFFASAMRLKEIPAVYSKSGKPDTLQIPAGFVCIKCGASKSLLPEVKVPQPEEPKSNLVVLAK